MFNWSLKDDFFKKKLESRDAVNFTPVSVLFINI
jgi:hypothetical protein